MFSRQRFIGAVNRVREHPLDNRQKEAILAPLNTRLFIVAGPGSGKTTVLALRTLKLIFVDSIDPAGIFATTFTRRAAAELRSRILSWGGSLLDFFSRGELNEKKRVFLETLDINRTKTGTLDSLSERIMTDYRGLGVQPPSVIDEFVSNAMLIRVGLFAHGRFRNEDLNHYLCHIADLNRRQWLNLSNKVEIIRDFADRFLHDLVDVDSYGNQTPIHPGRNLLIEAIRDYWRHLGEQGVLDYALLEDEFLRRLRGGGLTEFTDTLKAVLVDEYQDTNLLQEAIYFELGEAANWALTVVGDDDQSIHRFRGATVDLFRDYAERLEAISGETPEVVYLSTNYRSSRNIVTFYNGFVSADPGYLNVRVESKPPVRTPRGFPDGLPVVGIFRDNVEELAEEISSLLRDIFLGRGFVCGRGVNRIVINRDVRGGAIGDCALLTSSPKELASDRTRERLPHCMRTALGRYGIDVFNPRGRELYNVPQVQRLCGLILECIDPGAEVEEGITTLPEAIRGTFNTWRETARSLIGSDPEPHEPHSLREFVGAWAARDPQGSDNWPDDVPLLDLCYKLVTWFPELQDDPEGQIYLEAIARTISQAARFSAFDSRILEGPEHGRRSIIAALRDIFEPIAAGIIDVNEELVEDFPRNRLSILSVHQAKGLEFPMVIVDVGSDFSSDHWTQRFKRFPREGSKSHRMEDELRPSTPLGPHHRGAIERAFDDLVTLYYVAYSRAKQVLILTGLNTLFRDNPVKNVATGWRRDSSCSWEPNVPIILI